MKTIGLTGGIACGKSSVTTILIKYGIRVISTDELARQAIEPSSLGYEEVIKKFGSGIVKGNGQIDRQKLGHIIFTDNQLRKQLEGIIHPIVRNAIKQAIKLGQQDGLNLLIVEIPLLFEVGWEYLFDQIWVVSSSSEQQLQRLKARDHLTTEESQQRISAQLPLTYKEGKADGVIYNNDGLSDLEAQVQQFIKTVE